MTCGQILRVGTARLSYTNDKHQQDKMHANYF